MLPNYAHGTLFSMLSSTKRHYWVLLTPLAEWQWSWQSPSILSWCNQLTSQKSSLSPWIMALLWQKGLHNSMKLWAMPCGATQDGRVIVERSDKRMSTKGGKGKPFLCSCLENPVNSISIWGKGQYQGVYPPGIASSKLWCVNNKDGILLSSND